ncbi:MAG: hypothetical protein AB1Z23_07435 [Eubacteriales bacterium]
MNDYKRISVRFNLARTDHRKAWEILSTLPNGMMNEYITSSVLNTDNEKRMKRIVTECIHDVLEQYSLSDKAQYSPQNRIINESKKSLDMDALDFIKNL